MQQYIPLWPAEPPSFDASHTNPENEHTATVTPYLVDDGQAHGCVIVFPGGGYSMRAPHEGEPIARMLNAAGIHAFVLHYRVRPYSPDVSIMDARRAVSHVRANAAQYRVNPERIGVLGFSAGGHLAARMGVDWQGTFESPDAVDLTSARPDAIVPCYAVINIECFPKPEGDARRRRGHTLFPCDEHVTPNTPPAFLWSTANDEAVPVEHSLTFARALRANGVDFEMHIFPNGRHGLGLAEESPSVGRWPGLCAQWLKGMGF